jgi:hypothetical protein
MRAKHAACKGVGAPRAGGCCALNRLAGLWHCCKRLRLDALPVCTICRLLQGRAKGYEGLPMVQHQHLHQQRNAQRVTVRPGSDTSSEVT